MTKSLAGSVTPQVINYADPVTGALVEAQRVRSGLDVGIGELPNFAFGHDARAEESFRGFEDLDGDDLISGHKRTPK